MSMHVYMLWLAVSSSLTKYHLVTTTTHSAVCDEV